MTKSTLNILGIVLIILGVLGCLHNPILGIMEASVTHNVVHLLSGLFALCFARRSVARQKKFARALGIIYGVLGIVGLMFPHQMMLDFIGIDVIGSILHLIIAIVCIYIGFSREA